MQELIDDITKEDLINDDIYLYGLLESILFLSNDPLPESFFVKKLGIDLKNVKIVLESLVDEYSQRDGGIKLIKIAKGYQFVTDRKYSKEIRKVISLKKRDSLTKGMLETLAIVAYKQPVIMAEIDEIRGVSSRALLVSIMKRNLVKPIGRKELPGRPLLYGTTDEFLKYFGLSSLSDLPDISEIEGLLFNDKL